MSETPLGEAEQKELEAKILLDLNLAVEELQKLPPCRTIALTITKIQEGVLWLESHGH